MFNLILVDRGRLTNYLWGFIGCATWLIVAIMNHLVGDIFAQIFYVTMQFVGVWVWQRQLDRQEKNEYEEVNARMFTWWQGILAVIATIVIYLIVVFVSSHTGGVQVRLDGTLLPLGIVGQILMTYGYRSQWVAWIILDVIKVVIWFNQLSAGGPGAIRCSFFRWSCWPTVFTAHGSGSTRAALWPYRMICNQVFARKA